jgi:hypothetical protein
MDNDASVTLFVNRHQITPTASIGKAKRTPS